MKSEPMPGQLKPPEHHYQIVTLQLGLNQTTVKLHYLDSIPFVSYNRFISMPSVDCLCAAVCDQLIYFQRDSMLLDLDGQVGITVVSKQTMFNVLP